MTIVQQHLMTCAGSFLQTGAAVALNTERTPELADLWHDWGERCREMTAALDAMPGFRCPVPEGGFYAWADISAFDIPLDAFAQDLLRRHGIAAVPGASFGAGGEGYLCMTCMHSRDEIAEGMRRTAAAVAYLTEESRAARLSSSSDSLT